MSDPTQNLLTSTAGGTPVKNRIREPQAAFSIFRRLKDDQDAIARQRTVLTQQYNGNPPISQTLLNDQGAGWRSNINPRESKAVIDTNTAAIWDMFTSVPNLVNVKCLISDKERTLDYGAIVAKNFTRMLKEWTDFDFHMLLRIHEMLLYGVGAMFWRDEFEWKSEAVKAARIMVPHKTPSAPGRLEFCCIRDELSPVFLSGLVENASYAEKEGWNVAHIKEVLRLKYFEETLPPKSDDEYRLSTYESSAQRDKNLAYVLPASAEFDGIAVTHLLVEELDEEHRVSHYIIVEDYKSEDKYLFEMDRQYPSMADAIHLMLFSIGDGYFRSVKGLAHEIFSTCDISMRLLNSLLDAVTISSGLLLQAQSAVSAEKLKLMKKGPVTIIPEGLQALQSTFAPPLEAVLNVRETIQQLQNNNVGIYRNVNENTKVARTAKEVEIQAQNETRFESHQAS